MAIRVLVLAGGEFEVSDTSKLGNAFAHKGIAGGEIRIGDTVTAKIDDQRRDAIRLNHSATHLVHAALRTVLGSHVTQKGSLVGPERLRFDFSHFEAVTADEIKRIEIMVNDEMRRNLSLDTQLMELEEAKESGAMALFGEKYDDKVRVVRMGDFSVELCGGTHVERTGDIGLFKIISEGGIAAGVRRIEAVTGQVAMEHLFELEGKVNAVAGMLKADSQSVTERVSQTLDKLKQLEKEVTQLKNKMASAAGASLADQAIALGDAKLLVSKLEGADPKALRGMVDDLKNKLGDSIILLGVPGEGKVSLIAGVAKSLTGKVKAGELVNMVAQQVGGKGGGRPDMAQAGGSQPENLDAALASVQAWVEEKL